jgi:murein L,D-transpeptidase YafK
MASAALAAAIMVAGCDTDSTTVSGRSLKPISDKTLAEMAQKNMAKESPILIRLFKEESELEVWKQDQSGQYALLKTFPICRWSGDLGPKKKEGDRQAPEGFYTITPGQMNPASQYYLAFNTGYPNAYDRAWGYTGSELMVHGDCSSRGCYAMTDDQISEIYALGRESFFGGQRAFQFQAYPFRMTPANLAKHRNNPNMPFWKMLKEGNDHFEVTRQEPKVDVCEKRYVFDADAPSSAFNPRGQCPVYRVPDGVVAAVTQKQRSDEIVTAELINRGTPVAPVKLATDGGMHPVFAAAIKGGQPVLNKDGEITAFLPVSTPGKLPPNAMLPPPKKDAGTVVASAEPQAKNVLLPRTAPRQNGAITRTAYADAAPASSNAPGSLFAPNKNEKSEPSMFDRLSNVMGLRGSDTSAATPQPAVTPVPAAATKPMPTTRTANAGTIRPQQPKLAAQATAAADAEAKPASAPNATLLSGAAPVVPAGSFGNNWSALR